MALGVQYRMDRLGFGVRWDGWMGGWTWTFLVVMSPVPDGLAIAIRMIRYETVPT